MRPRDGAAGHGTAAAPTAEPRPPDGWLELDQRGTSAVGRRSRFLGLLLGLVADARATGGTDRATDDRAGRPGDRAADGGTGEPAGQRRRRPSRPRRRPRSPHRPCAPPAAPIDATDDGAERSADGHPDRRAAERAGAGTDGLAAVLLVLRGGAGRRVVAVDRDGRPGRRCASGSSGRFGSLCRRTSCEHAPWLHRRRPADGPGPVGAG